MSITMRTRCDRCGRAERGEPHTMLRGWSTLEVRFGACEQDTIEQDLCVPCTRVVVAAVRKALAGGTRPIAEPA